ncbi:MAG: FG-GAP-like repeat-containing protein, partial [Planctomycetota bacterium]|nr:FG-GAP-like repeat-containing protein [Planctomycetota bacterium]
NGGNVTVTLNGTGGNGGSGVDSASGGAGGNVSFIDEVLGTTSGNVTLSQNVLGGTGGQSNGGTAGAAGSATSTLNYTRTGDGNTTTTVAATAGIGGSIGARALGNGVAGATATVGSTITATGYTDSSVPVGTFFYFVKAVNIAGASGFSTGDAGFLSPSGPGVPTNVLASDGAFTNRVAVTWTGGANSTSYEVWRSSVNDLSTASNISGNVTGTQYDDVNVSPGQPNYYWVRGRNLLGPGPYSAVDAGFRLAQVLLVDGGMVPGGSFNTNDALLGDLDGDGDLDVFQANQGQGDRVLYNNGNGTFTDSGQSLGTFDSIYGDLGDIDGDGDLDAVIASLQFSVVWRNDGTGHFTDSGQRLTTQIPVDVELEDLDGDHDLDAFITSVHSNAIWFSTVWLNNGSGVFTDSGQRLGGADARTVQLADLEGDGDLDAFVANVLSDLANRVWVNDGNANFTDSGLRLGNSHTQTLAVGDLNGDGTVDLFEANVNDEPNRVYFNNGNGTFTDSGQLLGTDSSTDVALGDVDGDGDLDAAVSNYFESGLLYLNDGTGHFAAVQTLSDNTGQRMVWGDLDGDGDLDLFGANYGNPNQVYRNITQRPYVVQMTRNDGNQLFNTLTSLTFTFNENVAATVGPSDLTLFNTRTNTAINTALASVSLTGVPNQVRFNLASLNLVHGLYFVALRAAGISNSFGTRLDGNHDGIAGDDYQTTLRIAQLGDINLDGSVDGADVSTVFSNWNGAGGTWASGDLNFDNVIDGADTAAVYSNWTGDASSAQNTVTAPLPVARSVPTLRSMYRTRLQRIDAAMQEAQPDEWFTPVVRDTASPSRRTSVSVSALRRHRRR